MLQSKFIRFLTLLNSVLVKTKEISHISHLTLHNAGFRTRKIFCGEKNDENSRESRHSLKPLIIHRVLLFCNTQTHFYTLYTLRNLCALCVLVANKSGFPPSRE